METQLTLTKKEAIILYPNVSKEEKTFIANIFDRIQTIEDIEEIVGVIKIPYKTAFTKEEKCVNATISLLFIAKAYNENWIADWKNYNQYKWNSYVVFSNSNTLLCVRFWNNVCEFPSGIVFASKELLLDAQKKFPQIFKDYHMI